MAISTGRIPMYVACIFLSVAVAGTLSVKLPSTSVAVASLVPTTLTVAPGSGSSSVDMTLPVMTTGPCANSTGNATSTASTLAKILLIIKILN